MVQTYKGGDSEPTNPKKTSLSNSIRSSSQNGQEIKIGNARNEVKTESDVGFDESIAEDHFSEEPIEDEFEDSKQSTSRMSDKIRQVNMQNDNNSTVNMASVVPNPKLISTNLIGGNTQGGTLMMGSVVPQKKDQIRDLA